MKYFAIFCFLFLSFQAWTQLHISPNTQWRSTASTYVVLNDLGLQQQSNAASLTNTFRFTGAADATINGNEQPNFTRVELAKAGNGQLLLGRNISLSESFTFFSGLCDLNGHSLLLSSAALIKNESAISHFAGNSGGDLRITADLNAPAGANPGNLGAVISSSQNLGTVEIRRGHVLQSIPAGGSSIFRYYDILPANNTGLNATLRFHYLEAELNGLPESTLSLWKNSSNNWTFEGFSSRSTVENYVEKTGVSSFSRWTLSANNSTLPVGGLRLAGAWRVGKTVLEWSTVSEQNNSHFLVERRYAAETDFTGVGRQLSLHPGGTSQTPANYTYTDAAVADRGPVFYRLKQVDLNGHSTYSNIIQVRPDQAHSFIVSVYPTFGAKESIYLQMGNLPLSNVDVQVHDMNGRLLLQKRVPFSSQWLPLPRLAAGSYRLLITTSGYRFETGFVRQ